MTPPSLPISRAQRPPQLTTTSQETSPALVRTPATPPLTTVIPVTLTFSQILTPPVRAPRASAAVTSAGLAVPSPGIQTAPVRSSVRISGQRRAASPRLISSASTPKPRAMEAVRLSWIRRSAVRATERLPQRFHPVACPVSASSEA